MSVKSTILLFHPNESQREAIKDALNGGGLECQIVDSVEAALQAVQDKRFHVFVLASETAETDVFELLGDLRKLGDNHHTPALFAGPDGEHIRSLLESVYSTDRADFLMTPAADEVLVGKIRLLTTFVKRQDELLRENTELETNVEQMQNYVGMVAHDLRAPLSKLINISEVLATGVEEEELPAFYNLLRKTSRRGFDLVNDILDMAAVESGGFKLDITRCDIWPLGIQAITELKHMADKKDIHLVNEIEDPIEVRADGRRIFQVLTNLLTNAVKFTPRYGTINLVAIDEGEEVRIEVRDTGVGIPEEMVPKLFYKHQKTTTRGTDGERGTGFGLPLSQQLLKAHGSKITVQSEPGKGSIFSFSLPYFEG